MSQATRSPPPPAVPTATPPPAGSLLAAARVFERSLPPALILGTFFVVTLPMAAAVCWTGNGRWSGSTSGCSG